MRLFKVLLLINLCFLGAQAYGASLCSGLLKPVTIAEVLLSFEFPLDAEFRTTDPHLRRAIYEAFDGIDYYTKEPLQFRDMTIDHVIPKSKGGPHNIFNYVPTSEKVNREKGADFNWARETKTLNDVKKNYGLKAMSILQEQGFLALKSGLVGSIVVRMQKVKAPGYHVSYHGLTESIALIFQKISSDISKTDSEFGINNKIDLTNFSNVDIDALETEAENFIYDLIYVGADLREKNETSGRLLKVIREDEFGFYDNSKPVLRVHPQIIEQLKNMKSGMKIEELFTPAHISRFTFEAWRAE